MRLRIFPNHLVEFHTEPHGGARVRAVAGLAERLAVAPEAHGRVQLEFIY